MEQIPWSEIQKGLRNLQPVEGGYTTATRGILVTESGKKIFVKIGVNESTNKWINKETQSYVFLNANSYGYIPDLLSVNADQTGLALSALLPEDGWDWTGTWSDKRLAATLQATDALAAIRPDSAYGDLLKPVITDADNGWSTLSASEERRSMLISKLNDADAELFLKELKRRAEDAAQYKVSHDTLVHDDVRSDNCAWNEKRNLVKLVDWNWLEMGDRKIDLAAFLVEVHRSGLNVLERYSDRLDVAALNWIAGFWLAAASEPAQPGGGERLRDMQLRSGLTALELTRKLT